MRKLLLVASLCAGLSAQSTPDSGVVLRTTSREVLLDLVVRDKHEKLVPGLTAEDVEVFEDGVRQTIKSFRLVSGKEQLEYEKQQAIAAAGPGKPAQVVRNINLVAIVFQAMSPRGRDFARTAAREFLTNQMLPNTYVAVFSLDSRLNALQGFTNDKAALLAAVQRASTGNYSDFAKTSNDILNHVGYTVSGGETGIQVTPSVDPATTVGLATAGIEASLDGAAKVLAGIVHSSLLVDNYSVGMRSTAALLAMTRELGRMPGRKTVLYLSEGLVLPADNQGLFHRAISEANRNNVSFYSVDTRGLTTASASQGGLAELSALANTSRHQTDNSPVGGQFQDDYLQYAVRAANTQASMAELAQSTGGFLIADTNDLKKPLARVMEDIRTHYELTYVPQSTKYDGRFRKLEVRLVPANLHVQTRNGYYALPSLGGDAVQPFEMANLAALSASTLPRAFAYRAEALRFRPNPESRQCSITFEVPIANLKAVEDAEHKQTQVHASFLALVKDVTGQVVSKISRDVPHAVASSKWTQFQAGNMIFSEPFDLPVGRYTLETSVVDMNSGQASAKRSVLLVDGAAGVGLSSIALVRRVDPLQAPRDPADPLEFEGGKVTVTLADEVKSGDDVSMYFVVYPRGEAGVEQPTLTLQFFADGKEVARETPALPPPDASGAIPFVTEARLRPGAYEVRVTVRQATSSMQEISGFVVQ
ncbi:MAG TPA: hypothetical protein DEQ47_09050 [Solibacterales bacterium]|nr:hypothetical protein [Bryobacterales bacterium]